MRFTVKKMDEIKKSLSMIEENLLNAYVKVGTKKLFVHKNTLYTDPNFVKIAGHFQDGMAILKHKKKTKIIRTKSRISVKNTSKNSNNSRRLNGFYKNSNNKEILSESEPEPEMETISSENGNGNGNQNGNRKRNVNGNNSFEKVEPESVEPDSPVQSEESSEPESVQSDSFEESPENKSPSNTTRM